MKEYINLLLDRLEKHASTIIHGEKIRREMYEDLGAANSALTLAQEKNDAKDKRIEDLVQEVKELGDGEVLHVNVRRPNGDTFKFEQESIGALLDEIDSLTRKSNDFESLNKALALERDEAHTTVKAQAEVILKRGPTSREECDDMMLHLEEAYHILDLSFKGYVSSKKKNRRKKVIVPDPDDEDLFEDDEDPDE